MIKFSQGLSNAMVHLCSKNNRRNGTHPYTNYFSSLSNIMLRFYPNLESYSIIDMIEHKYNLSLNSDDPRLMNFTLILQFLQLSRKSLLSDLKFYHLIRNTILNSLTDKNIKQDLINEVNQVKNLK